MDSVTSLPHFDHFETERAGPVAVWRINRPGKANALTAAFWPQLRGLLDAAAAEPGVRAVVLTGSGDRSFSAGGDIEAFAGLDGAAARRAFVADCLRTFAAIEECRLPVIAAVNGLALGGGCELALACDMVLAAEHAAFGLPEASVGLVPGFGILRAPSVLGRHTAKFMVLAGERISAQRACELGLVQQVLPAAELMPAALRLGAKIAERAPLAVEVGKRMVNRGVDRGEAGYGVEAVTMLYATRDAAEGIRAFTERREPRFEGRLAMQPSVAEAFVAEPFVALMRRYCIDYTARHDLSVCDDIMVPGYTLHMGVHHLAGRDEAYKPAAAAQFRQFPGLCLTVNEIICSGDRLALRFTEHGASARHDGARAAWGGVGLYRWDGQRLLENYVEQDYFARRRQLAGDGPDPVEPPAVAPWDTRSVRADPAAEAIVRGWLADGNLSGVTVDDGHHPAHRLVAAARTEISVLFSAGSRVAFHAVRHGPLTGEDPRFAGDGEAMLHLAGVVRVAGGQLAGGRVITDRLGLQRRLAGTSGLAGP